MSCTTILEEFRINVKTLRMMKVYAIGFIDGQDNNDNTPAIMVGTCSKIK